MDRSVPTDPLDALSLDELMLSALYYRLIDEADVVASGVLLCVGNQHLALAQQDARRLLLELLRTQRRLDVTGRVTTTPTHQA